MGGDGVSATGPAAISMGITTGPDGVVVLCASPAAAKKKKKRVKRSPERDEKDDEDGEGPHQASPRENGGGAPSEPGGRRARTMTAAARTMTR